MKKIIPFITTITFLLSFSINAFAFDGFIDIINKGGPRETAILSLAEKNILTGYEDGYFYPENTITRAEMAVVLYRATYGDTRPDNEQTKFVDVPQTHWASGYINQIANDGIINGISEKEFAPEANLTNEQALKMIVCMKNLKSEAESCGGYPNGYVFTAVRIGIMDDIEIAYSKNADNSFQKQNATRGDIALMLYNALK